MHDKTVNYKRLYEIRFSQVDKKKKEVVWREIAYWVYQKLGSPYTILEPGCGDMEFLKYCQAKEKWGIDLKKPATDLSAELRYIRGDVLEIELPPSYFDAIFISNFLEHLHSPEEIQYLLLKLFAALKKEGKIVVLGPNFKFCSKEYFDCADHRLCLTEVSVSEHLFVAGFSIQESYPQFLPFSFRSRLPTSAALIRAYLHFPIAWRILGKQYLIIGQKTTA